MKRTAAAVARASTSDPRRRVPGPGGPGVTEGAGLPRQRLSARVAELRRLSGGISLLRLDPGAAGPFRFRAGQYARLSFGELPPRDYSIGSRPDEALLEFHIRDTGDGGSSSYVAEALREGDPVGLEGPFGQGFLREADPRPILAIAGGAGLAPMKSIVETLLAAGATREILLYFGVRREADVYLDGPLKALARALPGQRLPPRSGLRRGGRGPARPGPLYRLRRRSPTDGRGHTPSPDPARSAPGAHLRRSLLRQGRAAAAERPLTRPRSRRKQAALSIWNRTIQLRSTDTN